MSPPSGPKAKKREGPLGESSSPRRLARTVPAFEGGRPKCTRRESEVWTILTRLVVSLGTKPAPEIGRRCGRALTENRVGLPVRPVEP